MKWCISYSDEQDQFHIETYEQRINRPVNGYQLINWTYTYEEALKLLEKLEILRSEYKKERP